MLSIVIPSKNERFLQRTIQDILEKTRGDVEVFPVLDGYEPPESEIVHDPRVHYVRLPKQDYSQKRQAINRVVNDLAKGEFVMSLDAHCMMAPGFDTQLAKDHQPNWVQVPRRNRLDPEAWSLQPQSDDRPPIDYEYIMWSLIEERKELHGFKWDARTLERAHIMLDETMEIQASCWFMTKKWFQERGFMDLKYEGWGQEGEEIVMETYKHGGKVITNKNTWYAHLHKGKKYGRMYHLSTEENKRSYRYSFNYWVHENKEFFINFIERFMPIPKWPADWKEQLYGRS